MFGRRNREEVPVVRAPAAPETPAFSHDNPPTGIDTVPDYVTEVESDGRTWDELVREKIEAMTVTDTGAKLSVKQMQAKIFEMDREIAVSPLVGGGVTKIGKFAMEYPQENLDDPTVGIVMMPGDQARYYDFTKAADGTIVVTGCHVIETTEQTFEVPYGTRLTVSSKRRGPMKEGYVSKETSPIHEGNFMANLQEAIRIYNQPRPIA